MKTGISAVVALFLSFNAFATVTLPGQSQGQGQEQGQVQLQGQAQAMGQAQALSATQANTQSTTQSSVNQATTTTTVNAGTTYGDRPVASAIAPNLAAGFDTCMGSSSAGIQGMSIGLSIGSTWVDKNCMRLKNSRELRSMGFGAAAVALMCQDEAVNQAMKLAGTPCREEK